jgi:anti-sigma factor RsiW
MTNQQDAPERPEIEDLLPWHAAGTLSRREADAVEAALAGDPELRRRFALVQEEVAATIHLNETLGAPSPRAADRLFAAIDAEGGRKPVRSPSLSARIAEFFASLTPRQLAYAAAAGAVAIVLQAGVIGTMVIGERAGHQLASTGQPTVADGTFTLVRFAPGATAAAVTAFLQANQAGIVSGPGAGGLYRVRIAAKALPEDERDRLIERLAAETSIVGFIAAAE